MSELRELKDIDKWSQFILVFGFIRELEVLICISWKFASFYNFIPTAIKCLCLSYCSYFYFKDEFEKANDNIFTICNNKRTIKNIKGCLWSDHSIFGQQSINSNNDDICRWIFDIHSDDILIGICSSKNEKIYKDFTECSRYYPFYAFDNGGNVFTHSKQSIQNKELWEFGKGDRVTLIVHFEFGRILIKVNDDDMIIVFREIERSKTLKYHLALQMPKKDDYVTLVHLNPT